MLISHVGSFVRSWYPWSEDRIWRGNGLRWTRSRSRLGPRGRGVCGVGHSPKSLFRVSFTTVYTYRLPYTLDLSRFVSAFRSFRSYSYTTRHTLILVVRLVLSYLHSYTRPPHSLTREAPRRRRPGSTGSLRSTRGIRLSSPDTSRPDAELDPGRSPVRVRVRGPKPPTNRTGNPTRSARFTFQQSRVTRSSPARLTSIIRSPPRPSTRHAHACSIRPLQPLSAALALAR